VVTTAGARGPDPELRSGLKTGKTRAAGTA